MQPTYEQTRTADLQWTVKEDNISLEHKLPMYEKDVCDFKAIVCDVYFTIPFFLFLSLQKYIFPYFGQKEICQ